MRLRIEIQVISRNNMIAFVGRRSLSRYMDSIMGMLRQADRSPVSSRTTGLCPNPAQPFTPVDSGRNSERNHVAGVTACRDNFQVLPRSGGRIHHSMDSGRAGMRLDGDRHDAGTVFP